MKLFGLVITTERKYNNALKSAAARGYEANKSINDKETQVEILYKAPNIRKGWFVLEIWQDPLTDTWGCALCSFELKDKTGHNAVACVQEHSTLENAIEYANRKALNFEEAFKKGEIE